MGDDPLARNGLALLLAEEAGLTVVAQAAPGAEAIAAARIHRPHAAAWDLGFERKPDLEGLRALAEAGTPVLALLAGEDSAPDALAGGARGVLFRDAEGGRISTALRAIAQGLIVIDEALAASLLRPQPAPAAALVEPLTPRELEVLQLLSQGLSNRFIAQKLGISEHTAKFHVNAILGKLGVQGRTEAVVHAARLGLVVL